MTLAGTDVWKKPKEAFRAAIGARPDGSPLFLHLGLASSAGAAAERRARTSKKTLQARP